jgi:iron complex outermembrane receptor protein
VPLLVLAAAPTFAQRASENAVASASDAFGTSLGEERIGLYAEDSVRGFSPITAGNRRIEGMYIDLQGPGITPRLVSGSLVRVGLAALSYPFPAPSGIVDYKLREAGNDFVASLVAGLPTYGGAYAEIDAQIPIQPDKLSLATGAGYARNEYQDGRTSENLNAALIPSLTFERGSLTAFWTYARQSGDTVPIMVTAGPHLPPEFEPGHFLAQSWADRLQRTHTYGAIGRFDLHDAWSLDVAVFESRSTRYRSFIDLFVDVLPDGSARNVMISEPKLPARWTSGEMRLTGTSAGDTLAHQLHLSLRGRDKEVEQGGGATVVLGPAQIGEANPAAEPEFLFKATTLNSVTQWAAGVSYLGRWQRFAELNVGLQTTSYRQAVERDGDADSSEADAAVYSASLAVQPAEWLGFYAGRAVGLEETAAPPSSAANRDDAPPASRTRQWDAGLRLSFGATRIIAGIFETRRPHFATDAANLYSSLGERRNRGAEFSVVAQPLENLRLVGGAVYYDARVEGSAVALGRAGPRPLGSSPTHARLDLDYSIASVAGLSLQVAAVHTGDTIASTLPYAELGGAQLEIPAVTTLDIGARYRWTLGNVPMAARLLVQNVGDERALRSSGSNTFTLNGSRRLSLQLTADFLPSSP